MERTADAVLGEEADPNIGRYQRTEGLIDIVPDIRQAIGTPNGKSIMEHVQDIEAKQTQIAQAQSRLANWRLEVEKRLKVVESK